MVNAIHVRSPFLLLDDKRLVRQGNRRYQRALQAYPIRRHLRGRPTPIMRLVILCHKFGSCLCLRVLVLEFSRGADIVLLFAHQFFVLQPR